jgi:hypothetical protein
VVAVFEQQHAKDVGGDVRHMDGEDIVVPRCEDIPAVPIGVVAPPAYLSVVSGSKLVPLGTGFEDDRMTTVVHDVCEHVREGNKPHFFFERNI